MESRVQPVILSDMGWMNSPTLRLTLSENVLYLSQDCTVRCVSSCPSLCTVRVHTLVAIAVVVNSRWEVWTLPLFTFMRRGSFLVLLWLGVPFAGFTTFSFVFVLADVGGGKFCDLAFCHHVFPWQLTA